MAIIHNGFINKKYRDSFKDTGLNDTDITTTKMYKGVKSMWEHLGFQNDDSDNPGNDFYWNNIVPKDYTFGDLNGISVQAGGDLMIGTRAPRTPYEEIIINESVGQDWEGQYYYPVLPKLNTFGMFEQDVNVKTTYGSASMAPITNLTISKISFT